MTEPLALPEFDPRRTRRAVRRGLLRTAAIVLALLVAIALVATLGSRLVQTRGDRAQRMQQVLLTALQIANPGYEIRQSGPCCDVSPTSMSFTVGISPVRARGGFFAEGTFGETAFTVSQDFFGRVQRPPLGYQTETTLTYGLYNLGTGNQPKADMKARVLAKLPAEMRALSVIELERPMTAEALELLAGQYRLCPETLVYENRPRATPITWDWTMAPRPHHGDRTCGQTLTEDLANFRAWVGTLRDSDEPNLGQFGLGLARLRKVAADGLIYAYVDRGMRIGDLRKLIDDPRVRTVRIADVTYDVGF